MEISGEAMKAACAELNESNLMLRLMLAEANVRLAQQARRIAELEAPAPVATLDGARERRQGKQAQPSENEQRA